MTCNYTGVKQGLPYLTHMGECGACRAAGWERHEQPRWYVGTVPGGFNDSKDRFHRTFDKGLDAYEKARKEGLEPSATTVDAVRREEQDVASQQRAVEKLRKVTDVEGVKVKPGVEV
jgi:hypothetical protein